MKTAEVKLKVFSLFALRNIPDIQYRKGMIKRSDKEREAGKGDIRSSLSIKRFAFIYIVLMGSFFLLIGLKPVQEVFDLNGIYTGGVVNVTSWILRTVGIPCFFQGSVINLPSISLDVKFGCNGLEAVMIYTVAIVAFPASWKQRALGISGGFVAIQIINVLRIAALAYAGVHFRDLFDYLHIYVAQGMMIAVSLAIFFVYLNYVKSDAGPAE